MLNPKVGAVQRQGALDRILAGGSRPSPGADSPPATNGQEEAGQEGPLLRKSYCVLRGRIEMLPTLVLRNRAGEERWFDWDGVTGGNLDDPGQAVLHAQRGSEAYTITLVGRSLDRELAAGLRAKRVVWIQELDELAAAAVARADPSEPVVTGIHITQGSVSSEWGRGGASR